MLGGIHLMLMIGPAVPVPAPDLVVNALTSVQVTSSNERSGFQLVFTVGKASPLLNAMLPAGYFDPIITRVLIVVTLRGIPNVLMDGVITRQEVVASNEPGKSTITVTGEDLSLLMDIVEMPFMRFPGQPAIVRVYSILAKYAAFGIAPIAIPPVIPDFSNPLVEVKSQVGTDRVYLKKLAADVGYVFFVEPGPLPGSSIAYWGPDVRVPIPQPALSVNMDAHTNVESISFSLDGLAKKIYVITIFDEGTTKIPIPIPVPNISILRPPMGLRLTPPAKVEFPDYMATKTTTNAISKALGISFAASDAITANGSLNVLRYGNILRARMMVGVRGAGLAYDGMYYVNSVTYNLKQGEFKQSFSLSRDGLISNTPMVLP